MRIIVVGAGKVGRALATSLSQEEHDIVILDNDEDALTRCEDTMDVMCVRGSGANAQSLVEAGVAEADIVIATTASDEINMLCCMISKRLGCGYTIARIRDPEYNNSLALLQEQLDIDISINPERATAQEISRLLRFPFANNIETFAKGRVEMVEFIALPNDPVIGIALKDLARQCRGIPQVLYAIVQRGEEVFIPSGDFVIREGDRVHVAGDVKTITAYSRFLGRNQRRVKRLMMIGGGRISYYLCKIMEDLGLHTSLIEIDPERAAWLSEQLPGVDVILGDGTDKELLAQEGLADSDAFVALSGRDEENLLTGLYAVKQGVSKVVVKNNRGIYADIISSLGLDSVVSPKTTTSSMILRYVRARVNSAGTSVQKLYRLMDGRAEALEFIARKGDSYIGVPLMNLTKIANALVAVIVRKGKIIIPFGSDTIEEDDDVIIVCCDSGISDLNEVIRK